MRAIPAVDLARAHLENGNVAAEAQWAPPGVFLNPRAMIPLVRSQFLLESDRMARSLVETSSAWPARSIRHPFAFTMAAPRIANGSSSTIHRKTAPRLVNLERK